MDTQQSEPQEFCSICHIGSPQPSRVTYARWHEGQFIVVPGMPAWRCDFCNETFYDDEAFERLIMLLGPESEAEDQRRGRAFGFGGQWKPELGDRHRI